MGICDTPFQNPESVKLFRISFLWKSTHALKTSWDVYGFMANERKSLLRIGGDQLGVHRLGTEKAEGPDLGSHEAGWG